MSQLSLVSYVLCLARYSRVILRLLLRYSRRTFPSSFVQQEDGGRGIKADQKGRRETHVPVQRSACRRGGGAWPYVLRHKPHDD